MTDQPAHHEVLTEIRDGAQVLARLAEDDTVFRAAVDAFRAQDGEAMQLLLERYELAEYCELICHWLQSKEAVLLCLHLAGPPPLDREEPDIREFAEVVGKVTADEELVELMADAVQERNADAWGELINRNGLERFSHLLCHWVCTVHYRLVCDVVCRPIRVERPHLIPELQLAGQTISRLAVDTEAFAEAHKAVLAGDCESLGSVIEGHGFGGFCYVICEWFCSWRRMLVCLRLCRLYPLERVESDDAEMLEFARATATLAAREGVLERFAEATLTEDIETVQGLVKEFQFERFCIQFCHWVWFLRCHLYCMCVCPPRTVAVFTKIGSLYYDTAVDSHQGTALAPTTGLTVADRRAFWSVLRLNGGISVVDGAPLVEYRFETQVTTTDGTSAGAWQAVTPGQIKPTNIGSFTRYIAARPFIELIEVWVNAPAAAGIFTIAPDADGWIEVPPMYPGAPMVTGSGWRFVPGSDLINFDTTTLAPSMVTIDETGVVAGASANQAPPSLLQTDVHYGLRMRMRNHGDTGSGTEAGTCSHIAINNTIYDHVSHHPYWPGGLYGSDHELAVASLGIDELLAAPCSVLTRSLTVHFTAAHSNLGAVSIWLEGPGGPYTFNLNPATAQNPGENWYGVAGPATHGSPPVAWTFASLPRCAYLLKMSVDVLLTTGDATPHPDPLVDYIAFCKG